MIKCLVWNERFLIRYISRIWLVTNSGPIQEAIHQHEDLLMKLKIWMEAIALPKLREITHSLESKERIPTFTKYRKCIRTRRENGSARWPVLNAVINICRLTRARKLLIRLSRISILLWHLVIQVNYLVATTLRYALIRFPHLTSTYRNTIRTITKNIVTRT